MWHMAGHKLHFLPIDGTRWKRVTLSLFIQRARTLLTSISRPLNDGPISRLCGDSCIICKTWNTISNKKLYTVARVIVEFLSRRKMIKKCSPAQYLQETHKRSGLRMKMMRLPSCDALRFTEVRFQTQRHRSASFGSCSEDHCTTLMTKQWKWCN